MLRVPQICLYLSDVEQCSALAIGPWNPKQRRRSKKTSSVADSAKILFLLFCGIYLQFTKCTAWPCNECVNFRHKHTPHADIALIKLESRVNKDLVIPFCAHGQKTVQTDNKTQEEKTILQAAGMGNMYCIKNM